MSKRNNSRQCAAATKSGAQCKRKATHGRYCATHAKAKSTKSATLSSAGTTGITAEAFAKLRLATAKSMAIGDVDKAEYASALNAKFAKHGKPFKVKHWSQVTKGITNDNNVSYYNDWTEERDTWKEAYRVAYKAKHKKEASAKVVNAAWGKVVTEARNQAEIAPKRKKASTMQKLRTSIGHTFKVFHRDAVNDLKGKNADAVAEAIVKLEEACAVLGINAKGLLEQAD